MHVVSRFSPPVYPSSLATSVDQPLRGQIHEFKCNGYRVQAWGDFDRNGNPSSPRQLGGFVSGMDAKLSNWHIGAAAISQSDISVNTRQTDITTTYFAGYAGGSVGPVALRSGGTWGWHDIDISRAVTFPGFSGTEQTSFNGNTGQVFGEAAYPMLIGPATAEPFAGLAFMHVITDSFHEQGGVAPLTGASEKENVGYSTLGLRMASTMHMQDTAITPHASIAWQHAFSDNLSDTAFSSTDIGFGGVPTGQNSALINVGVDFNFSPTATLGVSYAGQFANNLEDNAFRGRFSWMF